MTPRLPLILESIILLAHDLGLAVVAEGIQSQDDVDRLGALDLRSGPGLFHRRADDREAGCRCAERRALTAAQHKTTINSVWERMAGTSNVRVPEPLPGIKPEPQNAQAKDAKPESNAARQGASVSAGVKPSEPAPAEAAPAGTRRRAAAREQADQARQAADRAIAAADAAGLCEARCRLPTSARRSRPYACGTPAEPAAHEPEDVDEETTDLVKSEPAITPPSAGRSSQGPARSARGYGRRREASDELPVDADEPADQSKDDAAAQKARLPPDWARN